MNKLRVLLVDDHSLFRKGVAALLSNQEDIELVGEASNGLEGIDRAREFMPDVILMDIGMPRCNGLEATRIIKQEMPHVHIIMLTVADDDRNLFAAIKNGADGYLLKRFEPQELYETLAKIQRGEAPISGVVASKILHEFRQGKSSSEELTSREIEILELVVQGKTNNEIAADLCLSENTVKIHLRNILEKLHLQNRIQAALYAVHEGLVPDPFSNPES